MTAHLSAAEYAKLRVKETRPQRAAYTGYLPKRTDKNQKAIVRTLRQLGCMVVPLHTMGQGVFDLLCAKHGLNVLAEVKDGLKPPSARELTPAQKRFHFSWCGMRCVLTCNDDCRRMVSDLDAIGAGMRARQIPCTVNGSLEKQYRAGLYA